MDGFFHRISCKNRRNTTELTNSIDYSDVTDGLVSCRPSRLHNYYCVNSINYCSLCSPTDAAMRVAYTIMLHRSANYTVACRALGTLRHRCRSVLMPKCPYTACRPSPTPMTAKTLCSKRVKPNYSCHQRTCLQSVQKKGSLRAVSTPCPFHSYRPTCLTL